MQDQRYVWAVAAASVPGALSFPLAKRFTQLVATVDALALGVYAVVGAQKALATGGQYYVVAAFVGTSLFTLILIYWQMPAQTAAWLSIGATFLFRMLAIRFNWRTSPVPRWGERSSPPRRD
jgi:uncharacterized membrane protein YeiH